MGDLTAFLPLLVIVLLFYLLLIRPQSKRAKQQRQMQSTLSAGSRIMLTSGIHGELVGVDDPETVEVRVADGVVVTVARAAVATVLVDPATEVAAPSEDADPVETTDDSRKEL